MSKKTSLNDPVQYIKGVGPQRAAQLRKLGITTLEDALSYLPFRYEDRSAIRKIAHLSNGEMVTVHGEVVSKETISPRRKRFKIFELTVSDGSGIVKAKWFNQPFMQKQFRPGQELYLSGVIKTNPFYGVGYEMENPEYEFADSRSEDHVHTSRIVPVYRSIAGLGQKTLRAVLYNAVQDASPLLEEFLPDELVKKYNLIPYRDAAMNVHFPDDQSDVATLNEGKSSFHQRLVFNELLCFNLGLVHMKRSKGERRGISFSCDSGRTAALMSSLPFKLTGAQERVIFEIFSDMADDRPMNRLMQGDVGCGKTVVALITMLRAVECGYQASLMAPTEILAQQHYQNLRALLKGTEVKTGLLTSKSKDTISGADIVVGTHALIQEGVQFDNLGLIVIDEQHRFGVKQRGLMKEKGADPDTLIMTATPIPRTLALTAYGDMDYSCIDEMPPGRTPVETMVFHEAEKRKVYEIITREINKGGQIYVVYPAIEEDSAANLRSAEKGAEGFRAVFPEFRVELVHGRMKSVEKNRVMDAFKSGNIDILISTTVIEVGVDVPNANVMVIVHAERFGLSQLHQLRGRVGRGDRRSFCILLAYGLPGEDAVQRLSVMVRTNDGFKIAEKDLEIRGPGDFFGTRQAGLPDLQVANIVRDMRLVEETRKEAEKLLDKDPLLGSWPLLRTRVNSMWKERLKYFDIF